VLQGISTGGIAAGNLTIGVPFPSRMSHRRGSAHMWNTVWDELRETVWLASMIGALSAVGVGLAVALAAG
jgi:hypothetical protein